ncbi:serine hydrolase domain-containing protein [Brachybacterium alimentarium]|uniref:serine hydrolase domain-containing protein n=1 Tax=Brachybacterium alimentarium TaxID=47845 RepID=UPI000DF29D97|nr:serine hydrolase domain-containing protein [Brachybacterium alimentarium]RCS67774.1 class A beta-lactamase-related serine hydrolase [Brachybacterium alimentarium]RCS84426.1 class A beta-lactamase-related serine hydrolase [Brachybacterium alimentarium]
MSPQTSPAAQLLRSAVEDGVVPGGVIAVGPDPEPFAAGSMALGGEPMRTDAIFRIQSMTKLVTTVAALRLVAEGTLALDTPVESWLPELAAPRVLPRPDAPLEEAIPARTPITLRHLLTNTSGYGMILADSPLQRAMTAGGTEAGPQPPTLGADDWLAALSSLPLVGEPGTVWRYHHSFGLLGILLSRLSGMSTGEHLERTLFTPLGMRDTGYFVPARSAHRLPASYAADDGSLVEREPAGGGFHVGPPPYDMSHSELLSTAPDYLRFLRALRDGELLSPRFLQLLSTDQVPDAVKQPDSFFPGFWERTGWGFGVCVVTGGPHRGRWGWSGGAGTDFFVDPDGTLGLLLTQVEIGERLAPLLEAYGEPAAPSRHLPG